MQVPTLDLEKLVARDPEEMAVLAHSVREIGFLMVANTAISAAEVRDLMDTYRAFFILPDDEKRAVDMARTGSNRGWGAPGSEQVDPKANPDFKQVFDCGYALPEGHDLAGLSVYGANLWPEKPEQFQRVVSGYYQKALDVAMELLRAISVTMGAPGDAFDAAFDPPMALLRGNYYPPRPDWAGDRDFGIAAHTDYGCLTLLASDGVPGLEARMPDGAWAPVQAEPGTFIINFGEMLEIWTESRVKATQHRVLGGGQERISVPLFFNPAYNANVAPPGADRPVLAGEHLSRRFNETYLHLRGAG